jgi:hypothetical protein
MEEETGGRVIPYDDQYVPIRVGVILNDMLEAGITRVRLNFAVHQTYAEISSGVRDPEAQVYDAILPNARKAGIENLFPEFVNGRTSHAASDGLIVAPDEIFTAFGLHQIFWWQRTWSKLLGENYIVNPAYDAVCLENSIRPDGTNRKGTVIHQSPHTRGTAVDYTTSSIGNNSINDVHAVLIDAAKDPLCKIKALTFELQNHCVHSDILP